MRVQEMDHAKVGNAKVFTVARAFKNKAVDAVAVKTPMIVPCCCNTAVTGASIAS